MISAQSLPFYTKLLKDSSHIIEAVFPKSLSTTQQLSSFINLPNISKHIKAQGQIPINSFNRGILDPCWDMIKRGGKKWRPLLGLITSSIFIDDLQDTKKHKALYELIYITDLIHNASLIIDDLEDKSEMRRGRKCVHLLYGEDISVNAGFGLMIFPLNHFLSKYNNPIVKGIIIEDFLNEMSSLHLGQGWDIEMKCKEIPEVQSYIDTVLCKTGVCPRLIVKMVRTYVNHFLHMKTGKLFNEILDFCDDLSVGFQIWDDLMNLRPSTVSKNKNKIGEDITEGKLTIMVLHSLRGNYKKNNRLKEILQMNTKDQNLLDEAIKILTDNGSIEYSEKTKNDYLKRFEKKVKHLINDRSEYKHFNLDALNRFIDLKDNLIKV